MPDDDNTTPADNGGDPGGSSSGGGGGSGTGGNEKAQPTTRSKSTAFGMSVNAEYSRKYGFDAAAATRITARIVALPPPIPLMQTLGISDELIIELLKRTPPPEGGPVPGAELMKSTVSDTGVGGGGAGGAGGAGGGTDGGGLSGAVKWATPPALSPAANYLDDVLAGRSPSAESADLEPAVTSVLDDIAAI